MVENQPHILDLSTFLDSDQGSFKPLKLILLNQKLDLSGHLGSLIKKAEVIVCADGGANRLYDAD
jgi:hypothetical protein